MICLPACNLDSGALLGASNTGSFANSPIKSSGIDDPSCTSSWDEPITHSVDHCESIYKWRLNGITTEGGGVAGAPDAAAIDIHYISYDSQAEISEMALVYHNFGTTDADHPFALDLQCTVVTNSDTATTKEFRCTAPLLPNQAAISTTYLPGQPRYLPFSISFKSTCGSRFSSAATYSFATGGGLCAAGVNGLPSSEFVAGSDYLLPFLWLEAPSGPGVQ